jgi:hypothetical protein
MKIPAKKLLDLLKGREDRGISAISFSSFLI